MNGSARAAIWGLVFTAVLGVLIVLGSRNLVQFDAALVGYTCATLFATFGITYRYAMWLQRPPTRMYWRRGWRAFLSPRAFAGNLGRFVKRAVVEVRASSSRSRGSSYSSRSPADARGSRDDLAPRASGGKRIRHVEAERGVVERHREQVLVDLADHRVDARPLRA